MKEDTKEDAMRAFRQFDLDQTGRISCASCIPLALGPSRTHDFIKILKSLRSRLSTHVHRYT